MYMRNDVFIVGAGIVFVYLLIYFSGANIDGDVDAGLMLRGMGVPDIQGNVFCVSLGAVSVPIFDRFFFDE